MLRTCIIEGCKREHDSRGWCSNHYQLWKKYGNPLKISPRLIHSETCSVEGCNKLFYGKDLCKMHLTRLRRNGSLFRKEKSEKKRNPRRIRGICSIESCNQPHYGKGFCKSHYGSLRRWGDPLKGEVGIEYPKICTIPSCNNKFYGKGYCRKHYKRYNPYSPRHGSLEEFIAMNNVRKKYFNTCQWYKCNRTPLNMIIDIHHIFPVSEYPNLRYREEYMIPYCIEHHAKWHKYRGDYCHKMIESRLKRYCGESLC